MVRLEVPEIGDLPALLSEPTATELLRGSGAAVLSARPVWWRAPSDRSATVLYDLQMTVAGRPANVRAYAKTWSGGEAPAVAAKWSRLKPLPAPDGGAGTALLSGAQSVLFHFPNDGGLRLLREVIDLDRLKRRLVALGGPFAEPWRVRGSKSSITVVRWKPEHRCVVRLDLAMKNDATGEKKDVTAFARIFDDATGAGLADLVGSLAATMGTYVPRPLGSFASGRVYVESAVPGENLLCAMLEGRADGLAVGAVLAKLHASPVLARRPDPAAVLAHRLGELRATGAIAPGITEKLIAHLSRPAPEPATDAFLHGDLHPEQIILSPDGPVILDFERAARGDPMIDVGNFIAHGITMEADKVHGAAVSRFLSDFLAGYRRFAPAFHEESLARHTAIGLVQWAATRHRHRILEPTENLDRALEGALAILENGAIGR